MRAALMQVQAMLEAQFPSSPDTVESCLRRIKVVESCNLSTSMVVLEVVQETVGSAPLLVIMDGLYELAQQAKVGASVVLLVLRLLVQDGRGNVVMVADEFAACFIWTTLLRQ